MLVDRIAGTMITGPFGSCPRMSVGAILNAAVRNENVPLTRVESFQVGDGVIKVGDQTVARYRWFDGIVQPLFMWMGEEYRTYAQQHLKRLSDGKLKADFRLTLSCHDMPGFEVSGELATPALHEFLNGMLTNWTLDPRYSVHQAAGSFFQGGSHDANGGWFLIEFWKPSGTRAFMEYMNEHYDPTPVVEEEVNENGV